MRPAPDPHCKVGKVKLRPNRYRAAGMFNVMLNQLRKEVAGKALLKSVRG